MTAYLWDCIYCGYPTKHPSQTCPAHRDLAPPIFDLEVDAAAEDPLESPHDDARAGVGRDRLGRFVAADPVDPSRLVDRGSA